MPHNFKNRADLNSWHAATGDTVDRLDQDQEKLISLLVKNTASHKPKSEKSHLLLSPMWAALAFRSVIKVFEN